MMRISRAFVAALGVLLSSVYGSDMDGAANCADEGSCESEASSLLQLAPQKVQRSLLVQGKSEGNCPGVGARAYVTTAALTYMMDELFPFAYMDIKDGLLPMDPITGGAGGFDYDISNIKLLSFAATSAVFEFVEGRGIKVYVADIALSAVMDYKLASNSFWTRAFGKSAGVLSTSFGSGSFVSLTAVFGPDGAPSNITFGEIDAQLKMKTLNFRAPGLFDQFLNSLTLILKPILRGFVQDAIIELVGSQSFDVAAMINDALANSTLPFPLRNETGPFPYNVEVGLCGFGIGSDHVAVDAYAVVNTTASGVYDGQGYNLNTTGFTPDQSTMLGVGITEWTVNGFVWLARRITGLLSSPAGASPFPSGPVPLTAETSTLEDGRDLKAVMQESTEHIAKQLQVQFMEEMGVKIGDLSVQVFRQALGVVANIELDLERLLDHILGEKVRSHTKIGAAAAQERDRIDPPAARPSAAAAAAVPAVAR